MESNEMRNEERKSTIVKKPPHINVARLPTDWWEMMERGSVFVVSNFVINISVIIVVV